MDACYVHGRLHIIYGCSLSRKLGGVSTCSYSSWARSRTFVDSSITLSQHSMYLQKILHTGYELIETTIYLYFMFRNAEMIL